MKANVESQTFNGAVEWILEGSYFKLLTAAAACRVELMKGGRTALLAPAVRNGFYQRIPGGYDLVRITNTGAQLVEFLTAPDEGGSDNFSGDVTIVRATAMAIAAAIDVDAGAEIAAAAAASGRKKIVFRADPANGGNIAIGPTGVTVANAPILLEPGDVWVEEIAAPAAWFARATIDNQTLRVLTAT